MEAGHGDLGDAGCFLRIDGSVAFVEGKSYSLEDVVLVRALTTTAY